MKTYTLLDLIKLILAKWWQVLSIGLISALLFFVGAKVLNTTHYQASNSLITTHAFPDDTPNDQKQYWIASDQINSDILAQKTIKVLISNSTITKEVADTMNQKFPEGPKYTEKSVAGKLKMSSPVNTVITKITASDSSPDRAAALVNATIESSIKHLPSMMSNLDQLKSSQAKISKSQAVITNNISTRKLTMIGLVFGLTLAAVYLLYKDIRRVLK